MQLQKVMFFINTCWISFQKGRGGWEGEGRSSADPKSELLMEKSAKQHWFYASKEDQASLFDGMYDV